MVKSHSPLDPDRLARAAKPRRVVLHADDLGMNPEVTDGILHAFREGLLTSTSVLTNAPDAARALRLWQRLDRQRAAGGLPSQTRRQRLGDLGDGFDLGVHLNLTQGRPLTGARYPAELLDKSGCFPGIFGLFRRLRTHGKQCAAAIEEELAAQIGFVLDQGLRATHLNGHQYVEMLPEVAEIVASLLQKFHIPVIRLAWERTWLTSLFWPGVTVPQWFLGGIKVSYGRKFRRLLAERPIGFPDAYFGTMTAGRTTLATMVSFVAGVGDFQLAEIALHPGCPSTEPRTDEWHDPLARFRPRELDLLVSAKLDSLLVLHGCRLGRLGHLDALQAQSRDCA